MNASVNEDYFTDALHFIISLSEIWRDSYYTRREGSLRIQIEIKKESRM